MKRMKRAFWLAVLMTAQLILAACGPAGEKGALEGSWLLVSYAGKAPLAGTSITVDFADGQVGGNSGCNQYGGSYQLQGSRLTFGQMAMTLMACMDPAGAMEQEATYLALLGEGKTFEVNGGRLVIETAAGEQLVFERAE